jgi:lauroyl/myristoyl acyltransferase
LLPHGRGYEMVFYPPLLDVPSGDAVTDALRMNAVLERAIRDMPEQYMWTYKRFKTRPDGARSPYEPPAQ